MSLRFWIEVLKALQVMLKRVRDYGGQLIEVRDEPPPSLQPLDDTFVPLPFMEWPALEIARQLTMKECELFRRIRYKGSLVQNVTGNDVVGHTNFLVRLGARKARKCALLTYAPLFRGSIRRGGLFLHYPRVLLCFMLCRLASGWLHVY